MADTHPVVNRCLTEMGIVFEEPALAQDMQEMFAAEISPDSSHTVSLAALSPAGSAGRADLHGWSE